MQRPELKPCPFCCSPATWTSHTGWSNHVWVTCCNKDCPVEVHTKKQYLNSEIEQAAADWNRRAEPVVPSSAIPATDLPSCS